MRAMVAMGHDVRIFEPCTAWSIEHLRKEERGEEALRRFSELYPELRIQTYTCSESADREHWRAALRGCEIVILHEWNPPALAHLLLELRDELGFALLLHDTHHRVFSSPDQIRLLGVERFDGVVTFGESLRQIYSDRLGVRKTWTLHEAADTSIFRPRPLDGKTEDVVWVGNWGDDERAEEIREFLLKPAAVLRGRSFTIYGVRYPDDGLSALRDAGVRYGGYLPNLDAPSRYGAARLTVHIPRRQYAAAMIGIPTIRVFEALACGIPLICSPWKDSEELFREDDFVIARSAEEMMRSMERLIRDKEAADAQALRGLETVLSRHTCVHRAEELTYICEDLLS